MKNITSAKARQRVVDGESVIVTFTNDGIEYTLSGGGRITLETFRHVHDVLAPYSPALFDDATPLSFRAAAGRKT